MAKIHMERDHAVSFSLYRVGLSFSLFYQLDTHGLLIANEQQKTELQFFLQFIIRACGEVNDVKGHLLNVVKISEFPANMYSLHI